MCMHWDIVERFCSMETDLKEMRVMCQDPNLSSRAAFHDRAGGLVTANREPPCSARAIRLPGVSFWRT